MTVADKLEATYLASASTTAGSVIFHYQTFFNFSFPKFFPIFVLSVIFTYFFKIIIFTIILLYKLFC